MDAFRHWKCFSLLESECAHQSEMKLVNVS